MRIQTHRPIDKRIKNHYLMYYDGGCMYPIAQLKVPMPEFWSCVSKWLKDDFGITVVFSDSEGKEIK